MLIGSLSAFSTNYYVSQSGNDSNTGLSDAQAWKTVNKVNGFTFTSGDSILFKGGDVWATTYPTGGGLYSRLSPIVGNIVIGSYGVGRAEITGWIELPNWTVSSNWTEYSSGIWRMALTNAVNRLWINGRDSYRCQTLTLTASSPWRWESGYLYLKSSSNPSSFYKSLKSGSEQDRVVSINVPHVTLTNLTISGGNTCIFLVDADYAEIKNCIIGNRVNFSGIKAWSQITGDSITNVLVHDNLFITGDSLTYSYAKDPHTTEDACIFGNGVVNSKAYNNRMDGWSHSSLYFNALDTNYPFNDNEFYGNFITNTYSDYARAINCDTHSGSYGNLIHDNTAYDMSVGNQLNSNGLKFYNNIIDGIRAVPYTTLVGYGISISGYTSNATNMEIYSNTIKNCIDYGIKIDWYTAQTYQKSYNNIHDNNVYNNGIQLYVKPSGTSINHNTFSNNHFYSTITTDVSYYGGNYLTASEFNSATPQYNDIISTNDSLLKVGALTSNTSNDIYVIHNPTGTALILFNPYPSKDLAGIQYLSSVTLQPYTSKVLIKSLINPSGNKRSLTIDNKPQKMPNGIILSL